MQNLWKNKLIVALTNPFYLLYMALFGILYLELGHIMLDQFAIRGLPFGDRTEQFLASLFQAGLIFTLLAGAISIIYRLLNREPSETPSEATLRQKISGYIYNPFKLLTIGFYTTALLGMGSIAIITWELRGRGPMRVWRGWSNESFDVLSSILLLAAIIAIVAALRKPAPSGAAEDETVSDDTETTESSSETESSSGWWSSIKDLLEDSRRRLIFGLYVIAIIGAINLVIDMWIARDSATKTIWQRFFFDLFEIAVNIGYLLIAIRVLSWINKTDEPANAASDAQPVQRLVGFLGDLRGTLVFTVLAIASTGIVWFMISMWSARNAGAIDFWRLITFDAVVVVGTLAPVLVLWVAWNVHILKTKQTNGFEFLPQPYPLIKRLIYVIVYGGIVSTVLLVWLERPAGPARIWADMVHMLGFVATPVALMIAARAIYLVTTGQFSMPAPVVAPEPLGAAEPATEG